MKKYMRFVAALAAAAMILCSCGSSIKSAENTVRREFFWKWTLRGYELIDIEYDAEMSRKMLYDLEDGEDIAVFKTSFRTPHNVRGSLSPDRVYTGWSWELKRTKHSGWKIVNYGFG